MSDEMLGLLRMSAEAGEAAQDRNRTLEAACAAMLERIRELEAVTATSPAQWCLEERAEGNGGCGACSVCCKELLERAEAAERLLDSLRTNTLASLEAARQRAAAEMREWCAKVAEAEPELPGEPSPAMWDAMRTSPVETMRAAVTVTKANIAAAIRTLDIEAKDG